MTIILMVCELKNLMLVDDISNAYEVGLQIDGFKDHLVHGWSNLCASFPDRLNEHA